MLGGPLGSFFLSAGFGAEDCSNCPVVWSVWSDKILNPTNPFRGIFVICSQCNTYVCVCMHMYVCIYIYIYIYIYIHTYIHTHIHITFPVGGPVMLEIKSGAAAPMAAPVRPSVQYEVMLSTIL